MTTNKTGYNRERRLKRRKTANYLETTTGKGRFWENFACKILGGKITRPNHNLNNSFDFLWNGKKIDVKSSNLYYRHFRKNKKPVNPLRQVGVWRFDRGEIFKKDIDYFFCICLRNNKAEKWYLFPNPIFPKRGVTITERTHTFDFYLF